MNKDWIDASDQFTPEGLQKLRYGQTLGFMDADGDVHNYKIVRLNRKSGKVYMKPIQLFTEDDLLAYEDQQSTDAIEKLKDMESND